MMQSTFVVSFTNLQMLATTSQMSPASKWANRMNKCVFEGCPSYEQIPSAKQHPYMLLITHCFPKMSDRMQRWPRHFQNRPGIAECWWHRL